MKNYYTIIDCDPGIDDAMAIMNAVKSSEMEVMLISTVAGNLSIEETAKNALKLVELFGVDIPVSVGAKEPLKRQAIYAAKAQGDKGFGGFQFENVKGKPIDLQAEDAIHNYLLCNPASNTTIICLGPMTNIARLLIKYPQDKNLISRIIFMGGSKDENGSTVPYREFNVAFDPEAMQKVFDSGIPLVMVPMELGHIAYFDKQEQQKIKKANKIGEVFYQMFSKYNDFHVGKLGAAVHDSCAVFFATNPELFTTLPAHLKIKYQSDEKTGNQYGFVDCNFESKNPNATVCVDLDVEKFKKIVYGNLFEFN